MNILYDHQIFIDQIYGGPSRYFFNLIREIENKENIKVCAPLHVNKYLSQLPKALVFGQNIDFLKLDILLPYRIQKIIKENIINNVNLYYLNKSINNFKPNIIHKTYFDSYKTNLPVVLTVYDLIHEKFHDLYKKDSNFRPKKKAIERANEIICISKNTLNDLNHYYDLKDKKASVIHLASDLKENSFKNSKQQIYSKNNFLLYVGKRSLYKNFKNFVNAYSCSDKLKKDFKIYCFGGGKFTKDEIQIFKDLKIDDKIIHLEGDDNDLIYLYKNARALIYPSKYEGFGLPVLEAMSFNCPVICSNTSSLPEVCEDAVAYFDPFSIDSINNKIIETVYSDNKIQELKLLGSKRIKLFSWEKCANETIKIYNRLI